MRVFFPGVDLNDPEGARRHHYFTQEKLDKTDERQISNDICGALTRMYQRKQDEALDPRSVDALINRLKRNELVQRFHELEAQRKEERIEPVNLAGLHTEAELKKAIKQKEELTSCGSISGHLVTIPYQIIKHIPTSALLEA